MTTPDNLTPQQRLANSRQALVGYMWRHADGDANSNVAPGEAPIDKPARGRGTMWKTITRTVQVWWRHHPAHTAIDVAAGMANPVLNRYANEKPVQLLSAAAALGAALVIIRPWRLVSVTGLLLATVKSSGLIPTLLSVLSVQTEGYKPSESLSKTD